MDHDSLRRRLALATAVCFATLAALMPGGAPAAPTDHGCGVPAWAPAWAPAWIAGLDADC